MKKEVLISIITPYYKNIEYTIELAKVLEPQLDDSIEWLIIDDGCMDYRLEENIDKATIIHLQENSGGASKPRNMGLDNAKGEYIVFIDSDDLVSNDYIKTIKDSIETWEFDYCYFNWQYLENGDVVEIVEEPPYWNCCVWDCIYKRELIGDIRFDERLVIAEDYVFNKQVRKGARSNINKSIYYYRCNENGLTHRGN